MDLSKMRDYLVEFNSLPIEKYDTVAFTGGEVMAPYYLHDANSIDRDQYIPACAYIAIENGMTPVFKTNAVWGRDIDLMYKMFRGFNTVVRLTGQRINLDISLDRFHANIDAIANILDNILANPEFAHSVNITFQGLHRNSSQATNDLTMALYAHDIKTYVGTRYGKILTDGTHYYPVQYNLRQAIADVGRATDNKLGTFKLTGQPDIYGDFVMIDSDDYVCLNMTHKMKIDGRPLGECIQLLKEKSKEKQR